MGLKKRSKVNAEFSMSSLTDIIFLLLIFFMLTANFVRIQPFELPKSDSKTVAATSIVVSIDKNGQFTVNNNEVSQRNVEQALRMAVRTSDNRENAIITIVAEVGTPFDNVVLVMEAANRLKVNAIIATQPKT
ncbi:MAG: biopolymer transporter ExbD [Lewinellaceae bacterium]|nr:biopolymer transporter ExbD [Phaeodactylibacter sp.]MCB9351626.1 biopolymer transporter ExbD [Lewinellaceae bacterium]